MAREDLAEVDDGELVAAIARRDDAAMAEAVRRHRGPVLAFARRLVGDSGRAEEISQEVFLRLWERSSRFDRERGSLRSFLLAITHGRALDVLRSDTARVAREQRDAVRTIASRDRSRGAGRRADSCRCGPPGPRAASRSGPERRRARLLRRPQLPDGRPDAQRARGHRQEPHPQGLGEAAGRYSPPKTCTVRERAGVSVRAFSSARHARPLPAR